MKELSELQREIIETKESKVIVLASAAAGKTACLTERVKYLLENGVNPEGIVVFTFTNAAAEEMRKRIGAIGDKCFINTVHSYAFYLLMKNGIQVQEAIDEEDFDRFFQLIQQHPEIIEPVEYLLLDEAQDSNLLQYQFILKLICPKNLFIVGDLKQSIYEFNSGRPDILLTMTYEPDYTVYNLNENYRNAPAILRFAKKLINGSALGDYELYDDSICMNDAEDGYVTEVEFLPSRVIQFIQDDPQYGKWFVLTRSNTQLNNVVTFLNHAKIPNDTFKRSQITSAEFKEKMARDTVKVLTVHSAKGLEADNVIVIGVAKWNKKPEERRVAYVAATRARKKLIWMRSAPRKRFQSWE